MSGRRTWINLTFEGAAMMGGSVFLLLQLFLEPALWWSWPPWRGFRELFGGIALGLLALAPVSGVLLQRYIAYRTPARLELRPKARLALWLLGSLPLAIFFLIPIARRWMDNASTWALQPVVVRLELDAPPSSLPRDSLRHWSFISGMFGLWLAVTGVLLPVAGCCWLAAAYERPTILAACAVLHLGQAGCLVIYARSDLHFTHQSRRYLRLAPWVCLLPQPAGLFAMTRMLWEGTDGPRQKTLTWSAYAQTSTVRRHSQWLDLRLALQQRWQAGSWIERWIRPKGLEIPLRDGRAEAERRTWMRFKALMLPVEASLAIGYLAALTGSGPEPKYDPIRDPALRPWLLVTSLLATLGFLQAAAGFLTRLLRLPPAVLGPPTVGLYLFITQAALAFGLLAGPLAAHGRFGDLVLLTALTGLLAAASSYLLRILSRLFSSQTAGLSDSIIWPLCLNGVGTLPLPFAMFPEQAPIGISALTLLTLLTDSILALRYLPWILHPFTLRHLFDRRLMLGNRISLVFSALIAALPLGGLALPIWIWWHQGARQPSYELVKA